MCKPTTPLLFSTDTGNGARSVFECLFSNGTYVRRRDGKLYWKTRPRSHKEMYFIGQDCEGTFQGYITDEVLVERTIQYWTEFFGTRDTNCSSFANYLMTGTFVECQDSERSLVIEHGMRPFEMTSSVGVGDMVCLFYAYDRMARSRLNPYAKKCRQIKKQHIKDQRFTCAATIGLVQKAFSPNDIRSMLELEWVNDYHFMVCVAIWRGQPVWISQVGKYKPGGEEVMFSLTRGTKHTYIHEVPVITLIKKRR